MEKFFYDNDIVTILDGNSKYKGKTARVIAWKPPNLYLIRICNDKGWCDKDAREILCRNYELKLVKSGL